MEDNLRPEDMSMSDENMDEEEDDDEEFSVDEVAYDAYNRLDALVQVLVQKGVLTEEEVDDMVDKLLDEADQDDDSD